MSAAEKTERVMGALMDHLRGKYSLLSSSNVFRLQTNAAGTLTLILDLLSPKVDGGEANTSQSSEVQFLRDVNCGLQYLPTFQIVFTPMAIVSDQDSPPPSSRTLFNVLLVNYQGTILKKDFMTFYVNFPLEVIEAARAAAVEAVNEEGADSSNIIVDPDVELAEKTSSHCDILVKLDRFREFRLCCGIRKNRRSPQLRLSSVYVEPFGDVKGGHVVRSRECRFILEIESIFEGDNETGREPSTVPENCHSCQLLESKLTEVGVERLKQLSRVKVEVKDENSGATLVLPIETDAGASDHLADDDMRSNDGDGDNNLDMMPSDDDAGKENRGKVSVTKPGGKNASFTCETCKKSFRYIDSYWRHSKRCGEPKPEKLTPKQASMMVTLKDGGEKHTCGVCGRDFFHEVNWKKHEELCKVGRVKRRAIFRQEMTAKPSKKRKKKADAAAAKKASGEGDEEAKDGEEVKKETKDGEEEEEEEEDQEKPGKEAGKQKEIRECLICLKRVGMQWERHIRLHKERVGDRLYEQTACPSWDCDLVFEDRIKLNKHFLELHDAEAIPCVYCVRLILKDRIKQHLKNEHPHMSHMCTECGRECIYPSALKQHIKEFHEGVRDSMCELCGKSYPNERSLRKHLKTHAVKREHICQTCGKDFLTSTKLNEHRRVHTGAKPYQCKVCAYRAGKKENVQAHVRKVHNITTGVNDQVITIQEELAK